MDLSELPEEASVERPPLPGFRAGRDPLLNRPSHRNHGLTEKEEFDKKEGGGELMMNNSI